MPPCDYACMHLINNSTMHSIDVGQLTLCRGIDFLSLMSGPSLLQNVAQMMISGRLHVQGLQRGASIIPPPSGASAPGEERH